jgi:hypothetical protein|tara:strand:- start:1488 stop:1685 length:198 start_codon:yes stop_codon:yes gene_type:complete
VQPRFLISVIGVMSDIHTVVMCFKTCFKIFFIGVLMKWNVASIHTVEKQIEVRRIDCPGQHTGKN